MKKLVASIALVMTIVSLACAQHNPSLGHQYIEGKETESDFKAGIMVFRAPKFTLHFKNGGDEKVKVAVASIYGEVLFTDEIENIENLSKTYKLKRFPKGKYEVTVSSATTVIKKELLVQ